MNSSIRTHAAIGQGLLALLILATMIGSMSSLPAESFIYPACVFLTVLFAWSLWSWKRITGSGFDPYVLFVCSAFLFNAGQAFLEVFGLNPEGIFGGLFSQQSVAKTLLMVAFGLTAFHLGGILGAATGSSAAGREHAIPEARTQSACRILGWALLAVSIGPSILYMKSTLSAVMAGGYMALYQQGSDMSSGGMMRVLSIFMVPASLFLLAGSKGRRANLVLAALLMLGYGFLGLFMGMRGEGAMVLAAFAWLWHRVVRPISPRLLIGAGLVMLFALLPLSAAIRCVRGDERLSASYMMEAFTSIDNPAVAIISEMGYSAQTITYTMDLVPSTREFDYGEGYAASTLTVIPSLFWAYYEAYSTWLTWQVAPAMARLGGGLGFSFVAEAYMNFGWLGVPLVLGTMGFLLSRFTLRAGSSTDPAKLAAMASALAFLLIYPRADSVAITGRLVWCALIPYLVVHFLRSARPRAERQQ